MTNRTKHELQQIDELMRGQDAQKAQGGKGGLSMFDAMEQVTRREERARIVAMIRALPRGTLLRDWPTNADDARGLEDFVADLIEGSER